MATVTAHTLVKNEARFVWYAAMSVVEHVDKILLWDTGSTDTTREIITEIKKRYPKKVQTKFLGEIGANEFPAVRQKMLEATKTDWLFVVDGDEIWWEKSIARVRNEIDKKGGKLESLVVPTVNAVGDIYHYQEEAAGNYHLAGKVGHLALRAVSMSIPGLSSAKPHGTWGWVDSSGKMVQDRDKSKIKFINAAYLHTTFLQRAGSTEAESRVPKRSQKRKHEIGISLPRDYFYPEVFFKERPDIVPSVWEKMNTQFYLRALVETPLRKLKRRLFTRKVGY